MLLIQHPTDNKSYGEALHLENVHSVLPNLSDMLHFPLNPYVYDERLMDQLPLFESFRNTVAKIFFISLSSMYSVLVKHVLVFSYMQSRGFLEKFQVFLKNSKVFLNISLSTAYISVVGGGGEKVSEILKNF